MTFGEAYMHGLWDVPDLEDTLFEMMRNKTMHKMLMRRVNTNRSSIDVHYDLDNQLYEKMLGSTLCYSAARWEFANDLDIAQTHKLAVVVEKLELEPGMRVLDLGCGWGVFGKYCKDQELDVEVDGVTLSTEQAKVASRYCRVFVQDYREPASLHEYDRVISIGMLEHVGHENYREYFEAVHRYLKPDGIHLFECSAHNASHKTFNPWIRRYIFPDGMLPSLAQLCRASERLFTIEDVENFGMNYIKTCRAWWENCERAKEELSDHYDKTFWRMWKFYLLGSAAAFRSRDFQHYQVVMTKGRLEQPKRVQPEIWRNRIGYTLSGYLEKTW